MRPVGPHEHRDLDAIKPRIEAGACLWFGAYGVDAGVRTAPPGHLLQSIIDVIRHEIERPGARLSCEIEPLRNSVDGNDTPGAQEVSTADRELANRPAPPNRDCVFRLDVTEFRGHVAGRKDIGEK